MDDWIDGWMIEWLNDWMIERLNDWTIERLNDWTIERLNDWTIERLNDWTIERLNDWTIEWLNDFIYLFIYLFINLACDKAYNLKKYISLMATTNNTFIIILIMLLSLSTVHNNDRGKSVLIYSIYNYIYIIRYYTYYGVPLNQCVLLQSVKNTTMHTIFMAILVKVCK